MAVAVFFNKDSLPVPNRVEKIVTRANRAELLDRTDVILDPPSIPFGEPVEKLKVDGVNVVRLSAADEQLLEDERLAQKRLTQREIFEKAKEAFFNSEDPLKALLRAKARVDHARLRRLEQAAGITPPTFSEYKAAIDAELELEKPASQGPATR